MDRAGRGGAEDLLGRAALCRVDFSAAGASRTVHQSFCADNYFLHAGEKFVTRNHDSILRPIPEFVCFHLVVLLPQQFPPGCLVVKVAVVLFR